MATYPPPTNIEPITIFNPENFMNPNDGLTIAEADLRYLKFPIAQGTETFQDININGLATINQMSAPINDYKIDTLDRVYQELNSGSTWNAVNGYYGLSKDAFSALNPNSSGVQSVSTWTTRTSAADNTWRSVCWGAEIGLFVAVSETGISNRIMTSPNGITWTSRTNPVNNNWHSVVWAAELGRFVAVASTGTNNVVMTSPDGITWTSQTTPSTANISWRSVCWAAEISLFVAVADSGTGNRVMTSPDGITWTSRTSAVDNSWRSVVWAAELALFVAVADSGTGNRVMTSPDGITWTSRTSAADNEWRSVCWSPELGLFVAVAQTGTGNRVMTSPNGITWTSRTSAADNSWQSVCWSPELELFVAAGVSGVGRVMTSPDGITWTSRNIPTALPFSICWSPEIGLFVIVCIDSVGSGTRVITSSLIGRPPTSYNVFNSSFNNIDTAGNWTLKAKSIFSDSNITSSNRVYQELNSGSTWNAVNGYYALSKDAFSALNPNSSGVKSVSTWNTRTSATDNAWSSIVWAAELGLFAAISFNGIGNRVMTSPNGITWTSRTSAANNNWRSLVWAAEVSNGIGGLGLFVAVAQSGVGNRVMTSPDGITWTIRVSAADNAWHSVCWSPELGLFVAVAETGTGNRVMTSNDGITWTIRVSVNNEWLGVCWAAELGLFVAVAQNGTNRVMTSPDGITWTLRNAAAASTWVNVCWSAELGLFVAVAYSGAGTNDRVMTSPDGITWTLRNYPAENLWISVCWSCELGLFVAVSLTGISNRIMTSPNGITWTSRTNPVDNDYRSVCWSPELGIFAAVSETGTGNRVMTSALVGRQPTSYNVFNSSFNNIDSNGNWTIKGKEFKTTDSNLLVETTSGDLELKCNSTGAGGQIRLTGGTGLLSASAGVSSGQYLVLRINGTQYKIALLNV